MSRNKGGSCVYRARAKQLHAEQGGIGRLIPFYDAELATCACVWVKYSGIDAIPVVEVQGRLSCLLCGARVRTGY